MGIPVKCNHCKATWHTNKEYACRGKCLEPLCPLLPVDQRPKPDEESKITEIDRVAVRKAISQALESAAEAERAKHQPVNLHSMPGRKHETDCACTRCEDANREEGAPFDVTPKVNNVIPITAAKEGMVAKPPQAKIHIRKEEQVVNSFIVEGENNLYVEVPKAQFIHITPKGGKKK